MEFRDLKQQYQVLKGEIDQAMLTTAAHGSYILGPQVGQLEESLAAYVGVKYCMGCGSGTDALTMVLMQWGIGPGDAVFVPDFTFYATAGVVCREGATPVLVDVDPDTFNMDPERLEQSIRRVLAEGRLKPRLVIAVDLFGLPADYARIMPIASRYGLQVLEDGAQGFGGSVNGRRACSFGDAAITSFFPAKPLGSYGDGGAVFTNDPLLHAGVRSVRAHGRGADRNDHVGTGLNSRLDTLQAAILQVKFKAFQEYELERVNQVADAYARQLPAVVKVPQIPAGYRSSWAQYTIQLPDRALRDRLIDDLARRQIPAKVYYTKPLHLQTALLAAACPYADELQQASRLSATVLSLPMHPYLSEQDLERVALAVGASLDQCD